MVSHSEVSIRILDVNDNPPELATPYEASICEDAKPGQASRLASRHHSSCWSDAEQGFGMNKRSCSY
ncbi:hypothetical protein NHX12_030890 [Muraenolepis orangiensis]|uniref:Cadherin domain-containing protein n=1 Tax=Muraenolepis orangiensis TaxID=630683 RepID=A0A9Q0IJS8_9TELE|nr:hypothetical protein NHX12_030890 [Muraenolepis orangiensis]